MKKSFASRRVPRRIGGDDSGATEAGLADSEPAVVRPSAQSKPKSKSASRLSFATEKPDDETATTRTIPSRRKIGSSRLELRATDARQDDTPTYSKDYLEELKKSTPAKPTTFDSASKSRGALDIAAKFGHGYEPPGPSMIPTDAEIREKKERRARLAREAATSDASSGDDEGFISLQPKKYAETRLVSDDEDLAEGFDEFVEDGTIALGAKSERMLESKRRADMAARIADAEGESEDRSEDDFDAARHAAYEETQTRAGTFGRSHGRSAAAKRGTTPPRITPLPQLGDVLVRMRASIQDLQDANLVRRARLEGLQQERKEIAENEAWIQAKLQETGEAYEMLRLEAERSTGVENGGRHAEYDPLMPESEDRNGNGP